MTATPFNEELESVSVDSIVIWHGSLSNIPSGWLLADGNNNTPNLTDKFLKANSDYTNTPGSSGGNNSQTLTESQLPPHDHTASSTSQSGHTHGTASSDDSGSGTKNSPAWDPGDYTVGTSTNGSHSHTVSIGSTGSGNGIDNRPLHTEVAFIIKL